MKELKELLIGMACVLLVICCISVVRFAERGRTVEEPAAVPCLQNQLMREEMLYDKRRLLVLLIEYYGEYYRDRSACGVCHIIG